VRLQFISLGIAEVSEQLSLVDQERPRGEYYGFGRTMCNNKGWCGIALPELKE